VGIEERDRDGNIAALNAVAEKFAVSVTPHLQSLIDPADPRDPIARQFLPDAAELETHPHELSDPIGDGPHSAVPGIVHRYPDRVLFKLVNVCPVYCRFCFRREMVGPGSKGLTGEQLDGAIDYVTGHPEIWEVIFTGGDPLIVSPRRLKEVIARLNAIPHLGIMRLHSRVPVVDPARITPELVAALKGDKPVWLLLHANHAAEFAPEAREPGGAHGVISHHGGEPGEAALPASRRSRSWHVAFPRQPGRGAEADCLVARPGLRFGAADLHARSAWRPWKGAGRAALCAAGSRWLLDHCRSVGLHASL
jgi:hypothetical protein